MTIEEYIASRTEWAANEIGDVRFVERPMHVWSEVTIDEWSCVVHYVAGGKKQRLHLSPTQVCEFLNATWAARQARHDKLTELTRASQHLPGGYR